MTLVLEKLGDMVQKLAPAPGMKEPRWMHTFSGVTEGPAHPAESSVAAPRADRITALENEVAELRAEVENLKRQLGL